MHKFKMLFMKACTVAVIGYLSYPFFIKIEKEIKLLYKKLIGFLLPLIQGNDIIVVVYSVVICLVGLYLILCIFRDDEEKDKEEKQEEVEE